MPGKSSSYIGTTITILCFFARSCISFVVGPGNLLRQLVPLDLLLGTEVRPVEQLLQADDFDALLRSLVDHRHVLVDHRLLDLFDGRSGWLTKRCLDQTPTNHSGHKKPLRRSVD